MHKILGKNFSFAWNTHSHTYTYTRQNMHMCALAFIYNVWQPLRQTKLFENLVQVRYKGIKIAHKYFSVPCHFWETNKRENRQFAFFCASTRFVCCYLQFFFFLVFVFICVALHSVAVMCTIYTNLYTRSLFHVYV